MTIGRPRWRPIALVVTVAMALGTLIGFAVRSPGYVVRSLDLNDSGVWVSNNTDGLIGRVNKAAGALDAAFATSTTTRSVNDLDVWQDGGAVVVLDRTAGTLLPVDVKTGAVIPDQAAVIPAGALIDLRGGTLAVLDPKSGKLWATRYDAAAPVPTQGVAATGEPLAVLGSSKGAALVVTTGGSVLAVTAAGAAVRVAVDARAFGKPVTAKTSARDGVAMTAVGEHRVLLEPSSGKMQVDDGPVRRAIDTSGSKPGQVRLQAPIGDQPGVAVATARGLFSVNLSDGRARSLFGDSLGTPAQPAALGGCVFAAWSGRPGTVVRSCANAAAIRQPPAPGRTSLVDPVFRVNRDQIVLNDLATGGVVDIVRRRTMERWKEALPQVQANREAHTDQQTTNENSSPKAGNDEFGARRGTPATLTVLDNDIDATGRVLAIAKVSDVRGGTAQIAPDKQSIEFTLTGASGGFSYRIDNGRRPSNLAQVSVTARSDKQNTAPTQRSRRQPQWSVPAGGQLSIPVLADWRDKDGDPIDLLSASATRGTTVVTGSGELDFIAPDKGGQVELTYAVSDGRPDGVTKDNTITVDVQDRTATRALSATARPDLVSGWTGQQIRIRPLDNDLPGSDPADPGAHLQLHAEVGTPKVAKDVDLSVTTELDAGVVTVSADKPGTYFLDYTAAYGSATPAQGAIRVEIADRPKTDPGPIAMPDHVTLQGQKPALVDVLTNDADPDGGLLAVLSATPAHPDRVQVAVVAGRWLRVTPLAITNGGTEVVRYWVTNGRGEPVAGTLTIHQLVTTETNQLIVRADTAAVRAGDSIRVPVLDNDTTGDGSALTLLSDVPGAPGVGRLTVTDLADPNAKDVGAAYVAGDAIRYLAPERVTADRTVVVDYVAQTTNDREAGHREAGQLTLTIKAAPTTTEPNTPPTPLPIEARVVSGDTIAIPVPTSGRDDDGDSVVVAGIASPPRLGRVLGFSPNALTYQAYPTGETGTDVFDYVVTDRFGGRAVSRIRVLVVAPGAPQPPVLLPDEITAGPGATVTINPLANDLLPPGEPVTIRPLTDTNAKLPAGTRLAGSIGPIQATVPAKGAPTVLNYALIGSAGTSATATVTIRRAANAKNPPHVRDQVAPITGAATTTVDVLAGAYDPDGDTSKLRVEAARGDTPSGDTPKINGGKVTVHLHDRSQAIPFIVTDESGASSVSVVYVAAVGSGGPFALRDKTIRVKKDGSVPVKVSEVAASPTGAALTLVAGKANLVASPEGAISVKPGGSAGFTVTARKGYAGPAAVTMTLQDGPAGRDGVVTVPVQVGPDTPILRCPPTELELVQGGEPTPIDIASLCHVWTPDRSALDKLRFTATWGDSPAEGVQIDGSGTHTIALSARKDAPAGTGKIVVGVAGTDAATAEISVHVGAVPPPTLAPIRLEHVRQGESRTVDLVGALSSKLRNPEVTVVDAHHVSGDPGQISYSGSSVTITPGADATGVLTFQVRVADVASGAADRIATGLITLEVFGRPAPPSRPSATLSSLRDAVSVSWTPGAANGAPIDSYRVTGGGRTTTCPASPCSITGLDVGSSATFTVAAHNEAGWSDDSPPSPAVTLDQIPGAVTELRVDPASVGDGTLTLTWSAPTTKGSPITGYHVTWTGGSATPTGTSHRVSGLVNGQNYTFTVTATNAAGTGPGASTTGMSSGAPTFAGSLSVTQTGGSGSPVAQLTWPAADANGPTPVTYAVTDNGSPVSGCGETSCQVPVRYGEPHTFTVTATNGSGHKSAPITASFTAVGSPDRWGPISASADQPDNTITVSGTVPQPNGDPATVDVLLDGAVFKPLGTMTAGQLATTTLTGVSSGAHDVALKLCNAQGKCSTSDSVQVSAYGPLATPAVTATASGTTVSWSVSVPGGGTGREATLTVTVTGADGGGTYTVPASGDFSTSGSVEAAYETTVTVTATLSSAGRTTTSESASATTAPPPPDPTVSAGPGDGGSCADQGCHEIVVTTRDFPEGTGMVTCSFSGDGTILAGPASVPVPANRDSVATGSYYAGTSLSVTCGEATTTVGWPPPPTPPDPPSSGRTRD